MPVRFARLAACLVVLMLTQLLGCSSDDVTEEPELLTDIVHPSKRLQHLWQYTVGDGQDEQFLFLTPGLAGNTLFANDVNGVVFCIDAETGWRWWEVDLEEPLIAGAGADSKHVYVTTRQGELLALDRRSGHNIDWRTPLTSEALSAPVSNGDMVVVTTVDGIATAIDTNTGKVRWKHVTISPALSIRGSGEPVLTGEFTLVSSANGKIQALSNDDGGVAWEYDVSVSKGRTELERLVDVDGRALVVDDTVYVVGYQGKLAALDLYSGRELWSRTASSLMGPAEANGSVFITAADGRVYGYNRINQAEIWRNEQLLWRRLTTPVTIGDVVAVGDFEGYLHLLSAKDGSLVGRTLVDEKGLRSAPYVANDTLYILGNGGRLFAYHLEDVVRYPSASRLHPRK